MFPHWISTSSIDPSVQCHYHKVNKHGKPSQSTQMSACVGKSRTFMHPNFHQTWEFMLLEIHVRCSIRNQSGRRLPRQHAGIWALNHHCSHCSVWNKKRFSWKPSDMLIPCWCIHTHLARIESDTCGWLRVSASRKEMGQLHNSNQDNKQQTRSLSRSCRTLLKTYLATPCIIENGGQSHSQL